MNLRQFNEIDFLPALKALFKDLRVPINYVADEPTSGSVILKDTYKENDTFQLMDDVFFVGMVDDAAFEGNTSISTDKIKSDYCKNNNIKLVIIPYWDFDNIEQILTKELNIKTVVN